MRHIVAALALSLLMTGCESGGDATNTERPPTHAMEATWLVTVTDVREQAIAHDASSAQIALIDDAATVGALDLAALKEAALAAVECMNTAGLNATVTSENRPSGFEVPGYTTASESLSEDSALAIIDECDRQHFYFVSRLYQTQPTAREAKDKHFARHREALMACLTENGVQIDQQATQDEVMRASLQLLDGLQSDTPASPSPPQAGDGEGTGRK